MEPLESNPEAFYTEQKGYIMYNLHGYAINGFHHREVIIGDGHVGELVWMGRHPYGHAENGSVYSGLRLVSHLTEQELKDGSA